MSVMGRKPQPNDARLLEATVGAGHYRVLTTRPVTIALGRGAFAPGLIVALMGLGIEARDGLIAATVTAAVAAATLILALAAHEAGHLLFGRHVRGLVPRILLLRGSGGASIVEGRFQDPRGAALFAAGGPAASLALTVAYVVAAAIVPYHPVAVGLALTALLNLALLVLNLLPIAPTDGYALFRSLLWAEIGSRDEAERRAVAWSRAVLAFGIAGALALTATHHLAAFGALVALTALTAQHHAFFRRLEQ